MAETVNPIDVANADLLLSSTRAVRRRLDFDKPVEREVVIECLRLAVQAPTGANAQTWRWMMVADQASRERIAEIYREEGLPYLESGYSAATDRQQRRIFESALYLAHNLERAPLHVIPCLSGGVDFADQADMIGALGSVMPAVWSFQLALRSRGLGSAWTTLHLTQADTVADLLGIPEDVTQIALLPVAYTKGLDFRPAKRRPVEEITYWDQWG